ncbi:ABC transporter ATP-binding protein [Mesorhizobium sp. INR15]|uniref:ABC transporter ATP-binding protein n=1 Tax=Mesorhizobium sp. INR15 TaxID=2654248 RepID=UPI0018966184|nr:ABC transporter ATP-binding protein [Mesorhizobium sp. INR15]
MNAVNLELAMSGKRVHIHALSKHYGAHAAVDDVSIDIPAGTFCTILGASGSGKTTLLKMVAGYERPSSGSIDIDGRDVASMQVAKRNIGMVFQNYALFPHMSVAANLAFPLEMRGLPRKAIDAKVAAMLNLVGLSDLGARPPRQLSGGQQQRVALGRALIFQPDILLMDEPLGALDKNMRQAMQRQIKAIHARVGVTVLYVTHDQDEAMSMADLVVVMDQGRVVQVGSPLDIYNAPQTDFVATFLGDCNLIEIDREKGTPILRLAGGIALPTDSGMFGEAHLVGIRPERLLVGDVLAHRDIILSGTVTETNFNGADHDLVVKVDGQPLRARLANLGKTPPAVGSTVHLGCDYADLFALDVAAVRARQPKE